MSWQQATAVDTRRLAEWLAEEGHLNERADPSLARTIRRWRAGGVMTIWTADEWLTRLDRHLSELPDDAFYDHPAAATHSKRGRVHQAILTRLAEGAPVKRIAREVGVAPSTVRYWRERAVLDGRVAA